MASCNYDCDALYEARNAGREEAIKVTLDVVKDGIEYTLSSIKFGDKTLVDLYGTETLAQKLYDLISAYRTATYDRLGLLDEMTNG